MRPFPGPEPWSRGSRRIRVGRWSRVRSPRAGCGTEKRARHCPSRVTCGQERWDSEVRSKGVRGQDTPGEGTNTGEWEGARAGLRRVVLGECARHNPEGWWAGQIEIEQEEVIGERSDTCHDVVTTTTICESDGAESLEGNVSEPEDLSTARPHISGGLEQTFKLMEQNYPLLSGLDLCVLILTLSYPFGCVRTADLMCYHSMSLHDSGETSIQVLPFILFQVPSFRNV